MGALVGLGMHYREGTVCHAFIVTADNPPAYDSIDGVQMDQDFSAGFTATTRTNVAPDSVDENGRATGTASTWHYPTSCLDS